MKHLPFASRWVLVAAMLMSLAPAWSAVASPRLPHSSAWGDLWSRLFSLISPFLVLAESGERPAITDSGHVLPYEGNSSSGDCAADECTDAGWDIYPDG